MYFCKLTLAYKNTKADRLICVSLEQSIVSKRDRLILLAKPNEAILLAYPKQVAFS